MNILLWEKNEVFYLLELFTARGGDPKCPVCKQAAALVESMVKDKNNMGTIKEALMTKFCPLLGLQEDSKQCKTKADKLAPRIINLLSDGASPEQICQLIGGCVSTMSLSINP